MTPAVASDNGLAGPLLFDAVLRPHRSLPPLGFAILIGGMAAIMLTLGIAFLARGAWPVFGFCGLEILLVYWAFKASYRSGRLFETLQMNRETLRVRRVPPRGRGRSWDFQPYWLTIHMDDPPEHDSQLELTSHGRRLVIGAFLTPEERLEVAEALRAAIHKARAVDHPAPSDDNA